MIFLYDQYFLYKPLFPSSQPSKTLKIKTARSKSTGGPTYSSFGPPGATFSPVLSPKLQFFDQCFLYFAILGPLKARFDQLDRQKILTDSYLSYLRIFISLEMLIHEKTRFKIVFVFVFSFFVCFCFLFCLVLIGQNDRS